MITVNTPNTSKYAAPTDRQIESSAMALKSIHSRYAKDIVVAAKTLKKGRGFYARLAEETDQDALIVFLAVQAAGIIGNVDNGTDINTAQLTDDDITLISNCILAGGCPPWASERIMRISVVGLFLLDPVRIASIAIASSNSRPSA